MDIHFIVNPFAGNGRGVKRWQQFEQQLTVKYAVHWTEYVGHAVLIAQEISRRATIKNPICVVVIGGDGTIHEVVNGVIHSTNVYIGAISAGSGNDFARGYDVFNSGAQLERFIKMKNSTLHDFGMARIDEETTYFINNYGVGFDALVAITATTAIRKCVVYNCQ